ncbi:MAG: TRAP transporter small permease [candidate division KSB1 bacterium]|nr:TRAP transporter small permease [candidate division KSB1 bacterium]MDZ7273542.1 TRAP transporter small permease [candidate division KSB1 bacterium]MDZ7286867.1 TRAP transporter small permease [candidate division KSB1 bacterium]MDZ7299780.1 TRAP transporter small permease [candidate division KSB1 bacterium]MDZ7307663.1 TRAP transporter small permease [candidate division KSB1 bacterium]
MQRLRSGVDQVLKWLVIVLMSAMVLNVSWQVFTRFVLRDPSSYTEELARYLLIWVGLLGAAYAASQKMHLAIDILTAHLHGKSRHCAEMFIYLCTFLFALTIMMIGGIRLVNLTLTLNQISAALQIKLAYVYLALPLSGIIIMFYAACFFAEQLRMLLDGKAMPDSSR